MLYQFCHWLLVAALDYFRVGLCDRYFVRLMLLFSLWAGDLGCHRLSDRSVPLVLLGFLGGGIVPFLYLLLFLLLFLLLLLHFLW